MPAAEAVRCYKALANVERAFRSLKSGDLHVRPIRQRLEARVRVHIFLCMLAYYVEWHLCEAWRELLFSDEAQAAKASRDPSQNSQLSCVIPVARPPHSNDRAVCYEPGVVERITSSSGLR